MLWFIVAGLSVVFLGHTAPFPFLLEAFAPSQSIWRMPVTDPPLVYLTYDDGPNPAATPQLLDVLREHDARATFFLIDAHLTEETATIVRRMFNDGHAVGLHADTRMLTVKTPAALAALLRGNADRMEQLTGHRPCRVFRPHAGWRSGSMYEGLARIEHRLVGWTWGLWDWNWYRPRDAARLAGRLGRAVSPGDIVVMHDGHHENPGADRQYAIEATRRLVPALRARGYRFGALCEPSDPVTTGSSTANTGAASSNSWLAFVFRPFPPRRSSKVVELSSLPDPITQEQMYETDVSSEAADADLAERMATGNREAFASLSGDTMESLADLGVVLDADRVGEPIQTDVVFGEGGLARAIRLAYQHAGRSR